MPTASVRAIAQAQVARFHMVREAAPSQLQLLFHRAVEPTDIRNALLKERPVLDWLRRFDPVDPDPHPLRVQAMTHGYLDADADDLAFRRLYPAMDLGVYCANHAVGKPSRAARAALYEHAMEQALYGVAGFLEAGWIDRIDELRHVLGAMVGDEGLIAGDVWFFPNCSDGLAALLNGLPSSRAGGGRLVSTEAHFTTGTYLHRHWAAQTGGNFVEVPFDDQEVVPTERVVEALTPATTVVSLSSTTWRVGQVQDVAAISAEMRRICPDATLLVDAYQGLGTVPLDVAWLPERSAVIAGGLKQLRAGTGTGFVWASRALLAEHVPDRTGWWAHAEPLAFEPTMRLGEGATRLRTGSPPLPAIIALLAELNVFKSSGHDEGFAGAIARARRITRFHGEQALLAAQELGMKHRGPADSADRGAFFALETAHGPTELEALANEGIIVDFRADEPGGIAGILRMSSSAASFRYELLYAIERLGAIRQAMGSA